MPDDGEVYGCASVSLLDLAKGRTSCCFVLPLQPVSTSRGGSCLDWKGRPGRYLEVRGPWGLASVCGSVVAHRVHSWFLLHCQ